MPKVQPATEAPSGRAARGRRVSTTLAEINVVPLVDVMLVLLIIFMSTRSGKSQIFTITRDGKNLKQITKTGNNQYPDWSK